MIESLAVPFLTLFVVIDPIGVTPLFAVLTQSYGARERRRVAIRGVVIAAVVLLGFATIGGPLLHSLGIGFPAFRIAGGILLLLLAIDMVMVRHSGIRATTHDEDEETSHRADISVFPVAIPLIAGPGALTSTVMLMAGARHDLMREMTVLAMLVLVLLLTLACLLIAPLIMRALGVTGSNVVTRIFGILLCALSIQFVIDGVVEVWRGVA